MKSAISGMVNGVKILCSHITILIKNLPFVIIEKEITLFFGYFGTLNRIILPTTKIIFIINYSNPHAARNAFNLLLYCKFNHIPLYLEWAPSGIFGISLMHIISGTRKPLDSAIKQLFKKTIKKVYANITKILQDTKYKNKVKVIIKNLAFEATTKDLSIIFEPFGVVKYIYLPKKINGNHRGFGFVQMSNFQDVQVAIDVL